MTRQHLGLLTSCLLYVPALLAGQQTTPQPASTIQANANLVVVDVVVTDARHNPVHKLAKSDFTVLENGSAQTIKSFEEHTAVQAAVPLSPLPKLPPGTFTNLTNAPESGALNVLLLDTLNTPMTAQADVRNQVLKYLKEDHPGVRMAVFGLTTRLVLLRGFTSDPELLRAVLNGKKGLPKGPVLMTDQLDGDNPGADDPMMDSAEDALGNDPSAAQILANLQQFEAETQSFQLQLRARMTLDAMNQLGRYLSGLPGRKNVIWFSGSFPINILPDGDLQNPFSVVASAADEFRETTELLSRGQVAVYPIDARGLVTTPMMNVNNSGRKYARNPGAFAKDNQTFFQQNADEHSTMQLMAEATGGEAYMNTNGLKEAVEKAIVTGSNYYTLTYTPTNRKWNGDYRKIQVKLAQKSLTLAYRRGYFADDPNAPQHRSEAVAAATNQNGEMAAYSAMRAAMVRGGPDPTQVIFFTSVKPSVSVAEPNLAPGNQATTKTKGPYQRYTVLLSIDARDLDCPANPDGTRHCTMDDAIFVYDADGKLLNSSGGGIDSNIPADHFASMLHTGIRFHQDISVPVKGECFLRIGVHDETSNRVGAVELPIAAVSKLPPLATAGSK